MSDWISKPETLAALRQRREGGHWIAGIDFGHDPHAMWFSWFYVGPDVSWMTRAWPAPAFDVGANRFLSEAYKERLARAFTPDEEEQRKALLYGSFDPAKCKHTFEQYKLRFWRLPVVQRCIILKELLGVHKLEVLPQTIEGQILRQIFDRGDLPKLTQYIENAEQTPGNQFPYIPQS